MEQRKTLRILSLIYVLSVLCFSVPVNAITENEGKTLNFSYSRDVNDPYTIWHKHIFKEAFSRLGYTLNVVDIPVKRAGRLANDRVIDGELSRISYYGEQFPNLVKVEEANFYVAFSIFSLEPTTSMTSWTDIANSNATIIYRRGIMYVEKHLNTLNNKPDVVIVNTVEQALDALHYQRAQYYIDVRSAVLNKMNASNLALNNANVKRDVSEVAIIGQDSAHAWLHKSHQALQAPLSATLKSMKQEGKFELYRIEAGIEEGELSY